MIEKEMYQLKEHEKELLALTAELPKDDVQKLIGAAWGMRAVRKSVTEDTEKSA